MRTSRPVLAVALGLALALGGCTLFDGDEPDRTCRSDQDCFVAQGERCNMASKRCEVSVDAGVDAVEIDATVVGPSTSFPLLRSGHFAQGERGEGRSVRPERRASASEPDVEGPGGRP